MILKVVALSSVLCAGLLAVMFGVILLDHEWIHGVLYIAAGLLVSVVSIARLVRVYRRYHAEQVAAVHVDPASIVARWGAPPNETILSERGLVVGRKFLAFSASHQLLIRLKMYGDHTLVLVFTSPFSSDTYTRQVAVPPEALPAVQQFVARRNSIFLR